MKALGIDLGGTHAKAALIEDGRVLWRGTTPAYASPSVAVILESLRTTLAPLPHDGMVAGLCVPGVYDHSSGQIAESVNLPTLVGVSLADLITQAVPSATLAGVFPDALAAAIDFADEHAPTGRLAAVSLGTGAGLSVIDDGQPLRVSAPGLGLSSGHLGQVDVSATMDGPAPIGPDGGTGSLEAYIGAPALRLRLGDDLFRALPKLTPDDLAIRALVRALRIVHAIYRPHQIALLGGIALGIAHLRHEIEAKVADGLTSLARPGWRILIAEHQHHAACGAARLAVRASQART